MGKAKQTFNLAVERTEDICPTGEIVSAKNMNQQKIPVLSCEGACIRGEIARLAANKLAKEEPYRRACHGELLTVPDSTMSRWVRDAEKVILIDGCFLNCHGRILKDLIGEEKLIQFDALSIYRKYTDLFDIDAVPAVEREEVAQQVAAEVLAKLCEQTTKRT